jgi:hypothetical protein
VLRETEDEEDSDTLDRQASDAIRALKKGL